ncbi:YqjF family protein [Halovivax sp.]|uniref:YqjF family protein n=1 Tax=Halovivax sp. TaxID=1935978 RepID=UPI0025C0DCBF|nr:DUF2071 domain-containing protein [Halovivax sp.]
MRWLDLLFAHWRVEPETVDRRLPDGVTVDTYETDAYLGVVPFVMDDIRLTGVPIGLSFGELNLRTYVTVDGRPGVYFFNLDADDFLGVAIARSLFRLPYYRATMEIETRGSGTDRTVWFRSRRRTSGAPAARFDGRYGPDGSFRTPDPDSLEAFLTQRYRFYTADARERLYYGDIDHEPWRLAPAWAEIEANGLFRANDFDEPEGEPLLSFGRSIDVRASRIRRQ